MNPRCKTSFDVRFTEKSPVGTITLATLCRYLLEVADDHAFHLGLHFEAMFSRGLTWAVTRLAMEIPHPLSSLSDITVSTWPAKPEGLYVYRDYTISSASLLQPAMATSQWIVLDKTTRKPTRPPVFLQELYHSLYPQTIPTRWPVEFTRWNSISLEQYPIRHESQILVRRSDTDLNGHTNTAAYIEFMEEAIPISLYPTRSPRFFEIAYFAETFEKDFLVSIAHLSPDQTEIIHTLIRSADNTVVARGRSVWE